MARMRQPSPRTGGCRKRGTASMDKTRGRWNRAAQIPVHVDDHLREVCREHINRAARTGWNDRCVSDNPAIRSVQGRDVGLILAGWPHCQIRERFAGDYSNVKRIGSCGCRDPTSAGSYGEGANSPCCDSGRSKGAGISSETSRISDSARSNRVEAQFCLNRCRPAARVNGVNRHGSPRTRRAVPVPKPEVNRRSVFRQPSDDYRRIEGCPRRDVRQPL